MRAIATAEPDGATELGDEGIELHFTGENYDGGTAVAMIDADGSNLEVVLEPEVVGTSNRPYPRLRPVSSSK